MVEIPIVDLTQYLETGADPEACRVLRAAMENLGLLFIRDSRIPSTLPGKYREMMTDFYRLPEEVKRKYVMPKLPDGRQIYENGWRPPFTEKSRRRTEVLPLIPEGAKPHEPPVADPKERYMSPIGPRRKRTNYPMLDFEVGIVPQEIPSWSYLSFAWGKVMYEAMMTVVEMLAVGFDEPKDLFTSLMKYGPHRLAPTGLDLSRHGAPGTVVAGFHNDLSCLTMHGRANFPGLWAWTRTWERFSVELPDDGCLLVQSGRVLEHLTAGRTLRGYHEVVMGKETPRLIRELFPQGEAPWRDSTTAFFNVHTDTPIKPVGRFEREPGAKNHDLGMTSGERMLETLFRKAV